MTYSVFFNTTIVFKNNDLMPHNLLIVEPGAIQEVGNTADRMAASPDGMAKGYIPDSSKVLKAIRLLQSGEEGRLELTIPAGFTGSYPFICTFPGHWRSMRGVIEVVSGE